MGIRTLSLEAAAALLHEDGVVAYPTEAVWGLGCDPMSRAAVEKLLAIKQRPVDKGLILIAARVDQLDDVLDWSALPDERRAAVIDSWPAANTWIVPASANAPAWVTGAHTGIAVRVSAHPQVIALCGAFGGPLVSTSANLTGLPAVTSQDALDPALLERLDGLLPGATGGLDRPSVIRDALTGQVLRG
ncbi:Sua5/YciO/YrdC/YwlC family protein [Pseudoxanthomonas sp.]|uniref:Sua5/YciO/YrdC/YwlC family protein n=1 Tax=Pseudoxanthomonas sp. TaxID=1871049 RepID=UPI002632C353|nr:Sua5/YciO/YrdC/YwlC family protein [Pseudoxanthomonas sp.]WDS37850.1 MAG: Sua5/YciO/YrdC/YwlC family protein [Pseudoxanthomonas sp.]